jgi:hypothetical protein
MSLTKEVAPVVAAVLVSALLCGSIVLMTPDMVEASFPPPSTPTAYSADHARAQATAKDEERAPTF